MTRKLTARELQENVQRRLRKGQRDEQMRLDRMRAARGMVDSRWNSLILWSPARARKNVEILRPEFDQQ